MASERQPKLLFVMSNDYGELGNARYILDGQDLLMANSSFLLPQKLFERNQRIFGCSTQKYSTIDHILQAVETQQPDIVFLFSGYLFAWDGLMKVDSVTKIVDCSKNQGFKLVTSDPYLGLLSKPVPTITDAHDSFQALFEVLASAIHFYPVPCDHLASSCDIRGRSTFNAKLIKESHPQEASRLSIEKPSETGENSRTWLFVLGSNDYQVQTSAYGKDWFASKLAEKFKYALSVGRKPILIAPDQCNQVMGKKMGCEIDQVDLISFCGYDAFTSLLLGAEATFYWNVVSNSMFHRVLNGLPNFFFDPGHLGRIQAIYQLAIENYFVGWEPVCLDQQQEMSLEILRLLDGVFQRETSRMRDHFRSAPSPQEFISSIHAGA